MRECVRVSAYVYACACTHTYCGGKRHRKHKGGYAAAGRSGLVMPPVVGVR